jgi:hypothetical protein
MIMTPDIEEMCTIQDSYTHRAPNTFVRIGPRDGIPDMGDIDPIFVSKVIASSTDYGKTKH